MASDKPPFHKLSPQYMFEQTALEHMPEYSFDESTDFQSWKEKALPEVLATLGDFPPRVEPNPHLLAEWEHDGLRKQRWIIEVGPHSAATFQINYPPDLKAGEKRAAIFCWHGHGPAGFGKEPMMGNDSTPQMREQIDMLNYSYGHQMAKAGFITFAIDWIGGGERHDSAKPNWRSNRKDHEWCGVYYLHATMLGMTSLSINVTHGMAATDFACTLPHVDADRLGVMGISGGGTMTVWSTLCDERFKAAEIICYSDLWAYMGFRDTNYCGMQVAPGLYKLVDIPELQGLIAPRPLLVDIGVHDTCFLVDTAMACYKKVEKIYAAARAAQNLELDLFPGWHQWGANKSVEFLSKHLGK